MKQIDSSYKLVEEVAPLQLSGRSQAIYPPETRRELVSCHMDWAMTFLPLQYREQLSDVLWQEGKKRAYQRNNH